MGRDFCWKASQEGRGECLAVAIIYLLMSHVSEKGLSGEKEAFLFSGFYFSPWAVFSVWESDNLDKVNCRGLLSISFFLPQAVSSPWLF